MPPEPSPEQRARDGRLAWIIVAICGLITLTLLVLAAAFGMRQLTRWTERQQQDAEIKAAQEQADATAAEPSAESDEPLSVAEGPAPPDTARPLGSPATWVGPDKYPPSALRNGYEGRVRVTVAVDLAGNPTGCAVRESSGHWSLDNATCAAMLDNARFRPGRFRDARVRHWTSPPIRWQMPD